MSSATGMMAVGRRDGVFGPPFQGLRVFLPRNYVPPERYSALQDALTHQGAEVFLNLNPFANSTLDYHVLADTQADKIKDMRAKGCRVVGPECVFRCARECKRLPDRDYTCCLALHGVSVLLTGFPDTEKKELEDLVASMDGTLQQQTTPDVDFVVAKDVLATKYKWACNVARKPVLTSSWLRQCAREHRQVPHDPHRMLPLAGLTICATGILFEDRHRIQEAAPKHGARYHADLTKECSHLIALEPNGRKFQAANTWGLKVVSQNWFWESIKHKVSLDETCFPVVAPVLANVVMTATHEQGPSPSPASIDNNNEGDPSGEPGEPSVDERRHSIGRDTAMYLSGCRIFLTGFSAVETRKLVNLVLAGGGTRHMEMNDTITHVILGSLPESGMTEMRQLAMWGAVYILQPAWLEECTRQRREVATDLYLVPQNLLLQGNRDPPAVRVAGVSQSGRGGARGDDVVPEFSGKANGSLVRSEDAGAAPERPQPTLPGPTPRAAQPHKCFAGHVFGFTNDYPAEQRGEVVRRVLDHGGRWEADTASAEYVLAPHGLDPVPVPVPVERLAAKFVSKHWIAQCADEGKLLALGSHPLFRPLPCEIPLAGFQGVRFCVSQYSDRDRKLLRKLCRVLKVKFTETFNSKITHLLCKVKAGEKYENAERLGIRCVTADWLYACAAQNMAVGMDAFQPREPTPAEKEVEHSFMTQRPIRAGQLLSHPLDLQTQASDQSNVPAPSQTTTFISKSTKSTTTSRAKVPVRRNNHPRNNASQTRAEWNSLSSQSRLDPWDASAPSAGNISEVHPKLGTVKPSQESISQVRPATTALELDPSNGMENNVLVVGGVDSSAACNSIMDTHGSEEGTANVVDAIEGLLRQTSKVKGGAMVEVMEVHKDLTSPEAATLSRRTREETHTHVDFKKPKLYPTTRGGKAEGGDSKSPSLAPNQEDSLRFDESQLDSQMVAYDDDHSERQNLMERVRTRSSSLALSSNNSVGARQTDKPAAAWKGDQKLGRLFKAAEANK